MLGEALEYLESKTFTWEIILVDDGSKVYFNSYFRTEQFRRQKSFARRMIYR
jgi:glycosyltransferase involved in cell wall biosynthesis